MINEDLILETMSNLLQDGVPQLEINAGFAAILASRLPDLSSEHKSLLSGQSEQLLDLASLRKSALLRVQEALQRHLATKKVSGH